jgi:hypothetical protein
MIIKIAQTPEKSKSRLIVDITIVVISLLAVFYSGYVSWKTNKDTLEETRIAVNAEAEIAVQDVNNRLLYIMKTGQDFADDITNGKIPYAEVENRTRKIMQDNRSNDKTLSKIYNISVSFNKGTFDANKPEQLANWLYLANRETGKIEALKRDYDYTVDDGTNKTSWFTKAINERKPFWQQPKYGDVSNNFLVSYTIPFYTSASRVKVAGVIAVGFSTDELKLVMRKQDYRKTGFAVITSDEGNLIYHPNTLATLVDVEKRYDYFLEDFYFINQIKKSSNDTGGIHDYEMPKTHDKAWVLFKKIPASNWNYNIVFLESELKIDQKTLTSKVYLIVAGVIFFIIISFIFFIRHYERTTHLWYFSGFVSIAFIVGTGFLWQYADIKELQLPPEITKIRSMKDVEKYKKSQEEYLDVTHKTQRFFIPTGVYVKAAKFDGSNDIQTAGYIWQKYQLDDSFPAGELPDDFCNLATKTIPKEKGVLLVEAFEDYDTTNLSCDKASYTEVNDRTVTMGWYFNADLRQPFDYSSFPLDKNLIWVRMRPNSSSDYIVLTPDFNSYPYIHESFLMGIDAATFVLPSWEIFGTFYTTQLSNSSTNYGLNKPRISQELLFNIGIKRVFLDVIFSTVAPIFIIYLILFVILFSSLEDLLAVLAINAGLLFSVALWHSGLRASLASTGVTYFETFYFVCYFIISLVCINSVLLASEYELPILNYKNNLLSKLIFTPLVSGITFVITLIMLFLVSPIAPLN